MSDCGVCIGGDGDYDGMPEFHNVIWPKARKVHKCGECQRDIGKGESYERLTGKFDGSMYSEATCAECAEIRDGFTCEQSPAFGTLWTEMSDIVFPVMNESCLAKLETVAAKKYLRERWMKWKGLAVTK